ncbi:proton channel OTOP3-like [Trichomycterus rosablanca]|uniref:proton channel OTOP3-like n=1 Tax=Trichomycterus rosablanca TaxID=2290929 RepID=UPI002F35F9F9
MHVSVEDTDHVLWIPKGRRLLSGLLGLNLVLLGTALLAGNIFSPAGFWNQGPELFLLILTGLSLLWMLWYLLWARRQPGTPAHVDHHAGSVIVMVVLMVFAVISLLLCVFRMGYYLLMKDCKIIVQIILSFMQAPFFLLQTYFLWAHSKDCIHNHKGLIRLGLMLTVCVDILLWFSGVTDDSVHMEIELENQDKYNSTLHVSALEQLWFIPAFGAHPQLQTGAGKQFFGFSAWFVLVNLGQPLNVFYRMHSTGALMELLTLTLVLC